MSKPVDISQVERIELLTYESLTQKQKQQVEKIVDALNSDKPDKLLEIIKKHYYFFVDAGRRDGEILHYALK